MGLPISAAMRRVSLSRSRRGAAGAGLGGRRRVLEDSARQAVKASVARARAASTCSGEWSGEQGRVSSVVGLVHVMANLAEGMIAGRGRSVTPHAGVGRVTGGVVTGTAAASLL